MARLFPPGFFDRLSDGGQSVLAPEVLAWTLEQLKDAIGRDLEALLNTRTALPDRLFAPYPESSNSLLNYGLLDFAGMCLASEGDRANICAAVKRAIERHEPRLHTINAGLQIRGGGQNRVDFVISAMLKVQSVAVPVHFDAILESSTQRYSIREIVSPHKDAA